MKKSILLMLCIAMLMPTRTNSLQAKESIIIYQLYDDEIPEEPEEPKTPESDPNKKSPSRKVFTLSYDSFTQTLFILFRENISMTQICIMRNSRPIIVDMLNNVVAGTIIPYSIIGNGIGCYTIMITINGSTYTVEIQI